MRLQKRDKKLLEYIDKFRCLSTEQIANLFDMNIKVCQRRLRILCNAGYLAKLPIPSVKGNSPNLFYLGREGALLLTVRASRPRFGLLFSHQQKNSDLLIKVFISFRDSPAKCEILPEHLIKKAELDVIPDGSFRLIKNKKTALFFIENDSPETEIIKSSLYHQDIETKIIRYAEMFRNNDVEFYNDYFKCIFQRFRILLIISSTKRLTAISKLIKQYDEYGFIWITNLEQFNKKPCRNIWQAPAISKTNLAII